jgi:hypothetical protein
MTVVAIMLSENAVKAGCVPRAVGRRHILVQKDYQDSIRTVFSIPP